jgi:hypothetical protein
LKALFASVRVWIPLENAKVGGPQSLAAILLPVMPVAPEMFWRFSKYGVTNVRRRLSVKPRLLKIW